MIEVWTEELPYDWSWNPNKYLGGTPETVVNLAKNLDDDVIVYYDGDPGEYDGVYYAGRGAYRGDDVLIAINSVPRKLGNYNIYSTNLIHDRQENYRMFDERIVISEYQKSLFGYDCRVIPLSCNKEEFYGGIKKEVQCLYSSSPDRGADFLREIWSEVEEKTGAKLICTYDDNITESDMIKLYKESQFWLHPGDGIELFCISALKAQAAGCIPIVVPNMALDSTVKYGVKTTKDRYKEDLIKAILNPPKVEEIDFMSWKDIANQYTKNVRLQYV